MVQREAPFNVVVLGGGAAGLTSAYLAQTLRARVALIEKKHWGGDCLYTGCVPSKALIKTAKVAAILKNHTRYGISNANFEVDFSAVMTRVKKTINKIEPHDSMARYAALGITCIQGEGHLLDRHRVAVNNRILTTKSIILAMGAEPEIPVIPGLQQVAYRTSETIWEMSKLPRRLVILGGGAIGCEMAQAFQRLGSQVTLIEMQPRLMQSEDEDTAHLIQKCMVNEGVCVITGARSTLFFQNKDGIRMTLERLGRCPETIECDELLIAVGRRPRTAGVDWSSLGVTLNPNGSLKADKFLCVNDGNIYACGDVIGPYYLTHAASSQAWYCVVNSLFAPFKRFRFEGRLIPRVTFTDPEIATVGLTEAEAKAQGISYDVSSYDLSQLDRAIAESEEIGRVKVLTARRKDRILGVSIVAPRAGEMIAEFAQAMKHDIGLRHILKTVHPYPTFSDAHKLVAGAWQKNHTPAYLLRILEKLHNFRR